MTDRISHYETHDESVKMLKKISKQRTFISPSVTISDVALNRQEAEETFADQQFVNPYGLIDNPMPRREFGIGIDPESITNHNSVALLQQAQMQLNARKSMYDTQPPPGFRPSFPLSAK